MSRIRSIKPEFWVSEQVAECSHNARLTFIGLWNFCDDRGVHPAKPKTLKAELFPMDNCSSSDVASWVGELIAVGLVVEFLATDGERYWHVTGWAKHQKIEKPTSKYPMPPDPKSSSARGVLDESSTGSQRPLDLEQSGAESKGVETEGKEGGGSPKARRRAPEKHLMPEDFCISPKVRAWAAEKGHTRLDMHLEAFVAKAHAKAYRYADWDAAFMEAVRENWAKLQPTATTGSADITPGWVHNAGFHSVEDAETAGCGPGNFSNFRDGQRVKEPA